MAVEHESYNVGDIVLIEILKKEKLATLIYIDYQNEKVGVKLIDPIFNGLHTNITTKNRNEHGLMLSMHRVKKVINGSDLLNQLTLYQQEINKSQRKRAHLLAILSNKRQKHRDKQLQQHINKQCIIKGLNVTIIDDDELHHHDPLDEDEKHNLKTTGFELQHFEVQCTLGIGGCAKVKLVEHISTYECFAMKIYRKSDLMDTKQKSHVLWEQKLLKETLNHNYIVQLIDDFEDDTHLYWLLELVNGGDLFSLIRERKRLSLSATQFFSAQIVSTFKYLHQEMNIIFRDLKPENVLIDKFGYIKLGDFGIAKQFMDTDNGEPITHTLCGTPEYLAPELLIGKGYSFAVDWWAFGVLIYEMLNGKTPFNADKTINIYNQIITKKITFDKNLKLNDITKRFIQQLLVKTPGKRLKNADFIMEHEFYDEMSWDHIMNKSFKDIDIPFIPDILNDKDTRYFDEYDESDEDIDHIF